jgi:hypothetical protein
VVPDTQARPISRSCRTVKGKATKIVIVVFDLLYLNGYDLRKLPPNHSFFDFRASPLRSFSSAFSAASLVVSAIAVIAQRLVSLGWLGPRAPVPIRVFDLDQYQVAPRE